MRGLPLRAVAAGAALTALTALPVDSSRAADAARTAPKPFNVAIRVFDPAKGSSRSAWVLPRDPASVPRETEQGFVGLPTKHCLGSGQDDVLPVDGPDEGHAIASTTANAAAFTTKTGAGAPLPVAFTCIKVEPRP